MKRLVIVSANGFTVGQADGYNSIKSEIETIIVLDTFSFWAL